MAISDQLTAINDEKLALKTAITAKGVDMTGVAFTSYHTKVAEITGGVAPASGWQPHPDWWDIKTILANDSQEGYTARYIFLLSDSNNTIAFPGSSNATVGGTAWKTSDGQFYTSGTTHTWDRAQDRTCALGYKTRYVIVYSESRDISINHRSINSMYVYFGDCNITSAIFGSNPIDLILQSVGRSEQTTCASNAMPASAFSTCASLRSVDIPTGVSTINSSAFAYCYALQWVTIPSSVTSIDTSAFYTNYALQSIVIPSGVTSIGANAFDTNYALQSVAIPSSVTSVGSYAFSNCFSLVSVGLGVNYNAALNISSSVYLSVSSMIAMFNNLKDNTGFPAKTLTLGATNLAKLTQAEKNIAINKNWNLA